MIVDFLRKHGAAENVLKLFAEFSFAGQIDLDKGVFWTCRDNRDSDFCTVSAMARIRWD